MRNIDIINLFIAVHIKIFQEDPFSLKHFIGNIHKQHYVIVKFKRNVEAINYFISIHV